MKKVGLEQVQTRRNGARFYRIAGRDRPDRLAVLGAWDRKLAAMLESQLEREIQTATSREVAVATSEGDGVVEVLQKQNAEMAETYVQSEKSTATSRLSSLIDRGEVVVESGCGDSEVLEERPGLEAYSKGEEVWFHHPASEQGWLRGVVEAAEAISGGLALTCRSLAGGLSRRVYEPRDICPGGWVFG